MNPVNENPLWSRVRNAVERAPKIYTELRVAALKLFHMLEQTPTDIVPDLVVAYPTLVNLRFVLDPGKSTVLSVAAWSHRGLGASLVVNRVVVRECWSQGPDYDPELNPEDPITDDQIEEIYTWIINQLTHQDQI